MMREASSASSSTPARSFWTRVTISSFAFCFFFCGRWFLSFNSWRKTQDLTLVLLCRCRAWSSLLWWATTLFVTTLCLFWSASSVMITGRYVLRLELSFGFTLLSLQSLTVCSSLLGFRSCESFQGSPARLEQAWEFATETVERSYASFGRADQGVAFWCCCSLFLSQFLVILCDSSQAPEWRVRRAITKVVEIVARFLFSFCRSCCCHDVLSVYLPPACVFLEKDFHLWISQTFVSACLVSVECRNEGETSAAQLELLSDSLQVFLLAILV
jgi:hypothetical protein